MVEGGSWWVIPSDSPWKKWWDGSTMVITVLSFYLTNLSISSREYGLSESSALIELWFLLDVALNFVTEHVDSKGNKSKVGSKVFVHYMKTWFIIDVLSVVPWEVFFLKPIIDKNRSQNFLGRFFRRTKGVVKVTRGFRGRHLRLFKTLSRSTRSFGVGARSLLKAMIKYLPKYVQFFLRMKLVIALRTARFFHSARKIMKNICNWGNRSIKSAKDRTSKINVREKFKNQVRVVRESLTPKRKEMGIGRKTAREFEIDVRIRNILTGAPGDNHLGFAPSSSSLRRSCNFSSSVNSMCDELDLMSEESDRDRCDDGGDSGGGGGDGGDSPDNDDIDAVDVHTPLHRTNGIVRLGSERPNLIRRHSTSAID